MAASSMHTVRCLWLMGACVALLGHGAVGVIRLEAQSAAQHPAVRRLEDLTTQRDHVAARLLADSILASADSGSLPYVDALYWRAVLAETDSARRRDLRRLVVNYAAAPHAADALVELGRLDLAGGDTTSARRRLERVLREYPDAKRGAEAALDLGRILMARGEVPAACAAFDTALVRLAPGSVERRNEVTYLRRSCPGLTDSPVARDSPPPTGASPPRESLARDTISSGRPAGSLRGWQEWSAQVAAYTRRADAEQMARRLRARGFVARVTATQPYRVRIGRFASRRDAEALIARLGAAGTKAILVEAERP